MAHRCDTITKIYKLYQLSRSGEPLWVTAFISLVVKNQRKLKIGIRELTTNLFTDYSTYC